MRTINLFLIISCLTFIFSAERKENEKSYSVEKQLLAKQLEYKNAVKKGKEVNFYDYVVLKEKYKKLFESSRNDCSDFENEDECVAFGCMWDDEEGCYRGEEWEDDDEWNDENECFLDCEGNEYINPEENPAEACDWLISIFDSECFSDCGDQFLEELNFIIEECYECLNSAVLDCSYIFGDDSDESDGGLDECSDLSQDECTESEFCEWSIVTTPNGVFEVCIETNDWNDDGGWDDGGDHDECGEGYLFDCSNDGDCCPESWIGDGYGDCEDQSWGCDLSCYDNDGGDCEETGDDGSWNSCEDLGYEECMMLDFCDWISDSDDPSASGFCIEVGEGDDGDDGDDCFDIYDCEGIPACDFLMWLGDGVCDDGTWGINFNCEEFGFDEGDCEEHSDDGGWSECSDLGYEDCMYFDYCEWVSNSPSGADGYCIESDDWNDDGGWDDGGNPDECGEGYLLDCSNDGDCCPESWIGDGLPDCEDQSWGCDLSCYDNDGGDCEELGDDDGGDYLCEDLGYEDCMMLDFCEWFLSPNSPNGGYCMDAGSDDGGSNEFVALIIGDSSASAPGEEVEVPLFYESNTEIAGIQFTISDDPNWVVGIEMMSHIDECFEVNSNDVNGDLIGIVFSLEGCELPISDSASHFASILYGLSEDAPLGSDINLSFEDAIVADVNGESLAVDVIGGSISISMLGDVTGDGAINVLDVVSIINFILYVEEPNAYQFWASDVNGDGSLNVLDVVLLVDLILE